MSGCRPGASPLLTRPFFPPFLSATPRTHVARATSRVPSSRRHGAPPQPPLGHPRSCLARCRYSHTSPLRPLQVSPWEGTGVAVDFTIAMAALGTPSSTQLRSSFLPPPACLSFAAARRSQRTPSRAPPRPKLASPRGPSPSTRWRTAPPQLQLAAGRTIGITRRGSAR